MPEVDHKVQSDGSVFVHVKLDERAALHERDAEIARLKRNIADLDAGISQLLKEVRVYKEARDVWMSIAANAHDQLRQTRDNITKVLGE